tara:strand:- start:73 stop:390 length:318 start_codon:yes stop_codon:yes gene_type:complete
LSSAPPRVSAVALLSVCSHFPRSHYQPFAQFALAGLRAADLDPRLGAYRFCTNAAYSAGIANVPTVGFGPSPEGYAHVADEYIELAHLYAAARGYVGIIETVLRA